jgi:aminoglycoside 2'-N-acetyltransferase I
MSSVTVTPIQVAHTADLSPADLEASRALLYEVFDDMTEEDWEHALGGMHALAWDGDKLIGHGSVVQRRLLHKGRALRTGYVEGVAVRAEHRRHGVGGALMAELERIIRGAYELGALGSSDEGLPFYLARGWQRWRGPTFALTPTGVVRTAEEDGYILVWPVSASLALDAELTCDWRAGDAW